MVTVLRRGLRIRNESLIDLSVVLSQLTPLHWNRVDAGETVKLRTGRVWFTLSATVFDKESQPRETMVAARLFGIVGSCMLAGVVFMPAVLAITGGASAATSKASARKSTPWTAGGAWRLQSVEKDGVFADGRTLVIRGVEHGDGAYQLYLHAVEKRTKRGDLVSYKEFTAPCARPRPPHGKDTEQLNLLLKEAGSPPSSTRERRIITRASSSPQYLSKQITAC